MPEEHRLLITDEAMKQIAHLQAKTEDADLGTIIKKALALYDLATDTIMDGGQIIQEDKDGEQHIIQIFSFQKDGGLEDG